MYLKKLIVIFATITALSGCSADGDTASKQRAAIQKMRDDTLTELYQAHPEAKAEIKKSQGYAVFTSDSSKIFLVGFGGGYGVVKDLRNGKDTYMKMVEGGAGLGIGLKQLHTVMIFNDGKALTNFITNGYIVGANANAAAKYDDEGLPAIGESQSAVAPDSVDIPKSVTVYELTEKGLAVQATLDGYKYWPDDSLNVKK